MKTIASGTWIRVSLSVFFAVIAVYLCIRLEEINSTVKSIAAEFSGTTQVSGSAPDGVIKLQTVAGDKANWPKDLAGAEALRSDLDALVKQMSPAAQDRCLPQLNYLRWSVKAIWIVRQRQSGRDIDWDKYTEACQSLLDQRPDNTPEAIATLLESENRTAAVESEKVARFRAVKQAETALKTGTDLDAAWSALEPYQDDPHIVDVRRHLRAQVIDRNLKDRTTALKTQLEQALKELSDASLRQVAVSRIYEAAAAARIDLVTEPGGRDLAKKHFDPLLREVQEELTRLATQQQESEGRGLRSYQKWGLMQIQNFERWHYDKALEDVKDKFSSFKSPDKPVDWEMLRVFPSVRELLQEKTGVKLKDSVLDMEAQAAIYEAVWGRVSWAYADEMAYRATRDAMVTYLAPIDERFLDPPVQELFRKAFQRGWTKLEGRDEQLYVAEQAAVVAKKLPSDFRDGK